MKKLILAISSLMIISCHKTDITKNVGVLAPVNLSLTSASETTHYFNIQIKNNKGIILYNITKENTLDTLLLISEGDSICIKSYLSSYSTEGTIISLKGDIGYNHCHNRINECIFYTHTFGLSCVGSYSSYSTDYETKTIILNYTNTFLY